MSLDELVALANQLLPQVLPDSPGLRQSELNPRLVRHFGTLGLLDEAGRSGRESRYGARHLLQLLVVRRLMAEGSTTTAVKKLMGGASDAELEALLASGVRRLPLGSSHEPEFSAFSLPLPAPAPPAAAQPQGNEALRFLAGIRLRGSAKAPGGSPQGGPQGQVQDWQRVTIEDGFELHLRSDFQAPTTPYERQKLIDRIEDALKNRLTNTRGKTK